jgi:hypothetical protein
MNTQAAAQKSFDWSKYFARQNEIDLIEEIKKAGRESEEREKTIRSRYPNGVVPRDQIADFEALERERDIQDDLEIKWHRLRLGEPNDR